MSFDVYSWPVGAVALTPGTVLAIPYAAARLAGSYKAAGAHFALAPNNALLSSPTKFTVAFNGGNIALTWNGPVVPAGKSVKFQFERATGPVVQGVEVALADMSNVDLTTTGFQPATSPVFTGTPTAPTAAPGTNTNQLSTTAFVAAAVAALVASSPAALDTLAELATALGNDANFATTVNNALAARVVAATANVTGTFALSGDISPAQIVADQNDYTPAGIAGAAILRINSDAARAITGIGGGADGRVLLVQNIGAFPINLATASGLSVAGNRFSFGVDRTLESGRTILLFYDVNVNRWRDLTALTAATVAALRVGTDAQQFLTAASVFGAAAPVAVAFAASQVLDLSTGINFDVAAATANFTLANPTNLKVGQSGRIRLPQDATGSRLISYGTFWKAPNGAQALSTPANAVDCLYYFVRDAATIEYTLAKAFA